MQKLANDDAVFLSVESAKAQLTTGALVVIDPTDSSDFCYDKLITTLQQRIHKVPKLSWLVREVPMGVDNPYWDSNYHCNVVDHVHRVSLSEGGGEKELGELAGELMSRPLDRYRPLWEVWFIDGLPNGRVSILMKTHHCLFDGMSGAGLGEVLADLEPNPAPEPEGRPEPASTAEPEPEYSDMEMYRKGVYQLLGLPYRIGEMAAKGSWNRLKKMPKSYGVRKLVPKTKAPRALFNGALSTNRGVVYSTVPLAKVKEIKNHFGITVNDVVLALCSSTLRRYLLSQKDLPKDALVAGVPVSLRTDGDDSLSNKVGTIAVHLETQIEDPIERLKAIKKRANNSKAVAEAVGTGNPQGVVSQLPPVALQMVGWFVDAAKLENVIPLQANTIISNVPGPSFPLYVCGGKVEAMFPIAPVLMGIGLNITVMSYMDDINFGFTIDPYLVPNPWYLAEGIEVALDELMEAIAP